MNNLKKIVLLALAISQFVLFVEAQNKDFTLPSSIYQFRKKSQEVRTTPINPLISSNITSNTNQVLLKLGVDGAIFQSIKNLNIHEDDTINQLNDLLGLSENYSFKLVNQSTDELNISHKTYHELYKGIEIEGATIMIHYKDGIVQLINGHIEKLPHFNETAKISFAKGLEIAKDYLDVDSLINDYPSNYQIVKLINNEYKLAIRVRVDSYQPFTMCNVFVDANTGSIIKKVNLIAHADVNGTAQTLYSGTQSFTCDSYSGGYRLRDNGRKIQTFNATNSSGLTTAGYSGSTDFSSSSSSWAGIEQLNEFTIKNISQSWWYTAFADEIPDLYIKVKDGSNNVVYTSNYYSNTQPQVTFKNINLLLTGGPYKVEIWDYDAVGGDDFGGSYTISSSVGTKSWAGSGNDGNYTITSSGHLATDVHWGMQESYDFYLNVFNRNSFDGAGSLIKQYINPPSLQQQYGNSPNNASAYPPPYNFMQYGLGDGIIMNPLVSLDVEGHEFTHMVVRNNGNGGLDYESESGALNESFADIFGTCIEFYSNNNPDWLIGKGVMVTEPYMRSMSDPNSVGHPDTYDGLYWQNPSNLSNDHGGVHTNSGVQNFWFYLLCQGGSGTNDKNNNYTVTGIGISDARKIAYRNLVTYLGPKATYLDSYYGSLQAAEDLFGNPSTQYTAVRQAWYAVGIGNDPNSYCNGTTDLTETSGTISDGSGSANYNDNADCKWVIAPPGATQITLNFSQFDTEAEYDTVLVYDGPDDTYPLLAEWWGNTLPPTIKTTNGVGAMCIKFVSDNNTTAGGWTTSYSSTGINPSCGGGTVLAEASGSFSDGSGSSSYGNNQLCYWFIAPPCANSVNLSFSQFNTELNYDGIIIYDDWEGTNQLAVYTGTSLPNSVTSNTGKMMVIFVSDYSTVMGGFSASYTSTGSSYCSGNATINSEDYGTLSDGSGSANYCNNSNCSWLIQPPQATSITLYFDEFDLEHPSPDGQTIYDAVEVYDGTNSSAPLLGKFSGDNIPPAISSSGGSLYIKFYSDLEVSGQGWSASYTSTQNPSCTGTTTLTAESGIFSDGNNTNLYANNSNCSWLIKPANASSITLNFTEFDTELDYDGVIIYDGSDNTAPILGEFSGTTIPSSVSSTSGSMYIEFLSDPTVRGNGWTASYSSENPVSVNTVLLKNYIYAYPNPASNILHINSTSEKTISLLILDILGQKVLISAKLEKGITTIDIDELPKGIYILKYTLDDRCYTSKIIVG